MTPTVPRNRKLLGSTASIGSLQSCTLRSRLVVHNGGNQVTSGPRYFPLPSPPSTAVLYVLRSCSGQQVSLVIEGRSVKGQKLLVHRALYSQWIFRNRKPSKEPILPSTLPQTFITSAEPDETNSFPHPLITISLLRMPYRNIPLPKWRLIIPK